MSVGKVRLKDIKLDFGVIDPKGYINGLLVRVVAEQMF